MKFMNTIAPLGIAQQTASSTQTAFVDDQTPALDDSSPSAPVELPDMVLGNGGPSMAHALDDTQQNSLSLNTTTVELHSELLRKSHDSNPSSVLLCLY